MENVVLMKAAAYVVDFLAKAGVRHVFEMAGGAIAHLLDALAEREDIVAVPVRHEQAGAFAAEGYARAGGSIGVAMATSGPGALNLLTGIGSCYFDSVPCLFLTGQVNTYEYKFEDPVRQNGFQETDIVAVARPLTKYATLVTDASKLRYELEKAVHIATSGRPGPVLLDIPMDVQRAEVDPDQLIGFFDGEALTAARLEKEALVPEEDDVKMTVKLLRQAVRPLILVGGGVRAAGADEELRSWLAASEVPTVCSLMGLDSVGTDYRWNLGLIGSYGHRYANLALANCDCLLVLGSRLDTRQTGTQPETFARGAKIVHVDVDKTELGRKVKAELTVRADAKAFLQRLAEAWQATEGISASIWETWKDRLAYQRIRYPSGALTSKEVEEGIDPNRLMEKLGEVVGGDAVVCLDVGQHQMWASQSLPLRSGARLLNAGGMGAMGFGLPAAIGAAFARPDARIFVLAGDGGLQVNVQELQTIVHWHLPIAIIVVNNRSLGMVRQFQDLYFGGRRVSTVDGYSCPDFVRVAEAYGIPGRRIATVSELEQWLGGGAPFPPDGPSLTEVVVASSAGVIPKLGVGRPIEDMEPLLDRKELRRQLLVPLKKDRPPEAD
ncbi:thiamine pyrophosphate-binding protein [Cohnella soli]|uniref:Thiamine pyrophosphate-binding protein n=1 Tax=Cohnella soli TaxID=425005 RepID=A0ABW0HWQ0_9BACL